MESLIMPNVIAVFAVKIRKCKKTMPFLIFWLVVSSFNMSIAIAQTPTLQLNKSQLIYQGAFRFKLTTFGVSRMAFAQGTFAIDPTTNSFYVVGHVQHQAIAQYRIPPVVNSTNLADLNFVDDPLQNFVTVFDRVPSGNPDPIDKITGADIVDDQLIINGTQFYDGDANNTNTTFVIRDPSNLAESAVDGFFKLGGSSHASGWMSEVPAQWQSALGGSYITGFASNYAINGRNSIGPTAFIFSPNQILNTATVASPAIDTTTLLDFPLVTSLNDDAFNTTGTNNLWTEVSKVFYGFIYPNTASYVTIGSSGGHGPLGIGYKITQGDGAVCGGPCPYDYKDSYNYIWLWNVNDLTRVKNGEMDPSDVRPYEYGELLLPFQDSSRGYNLVVGADFDETNDLLYVLLGRGDSSQNIYEDAPIMLVYKVDLTRPRPPSGVQIN
jgi:hypothetical protein